MAITKKGKYKVISVIAGIVILLFLNIEVRPVQIYSSSIFTTPENTEIKINVLMNTLLPIDVENQAKEIISEEQKINGMRENSVYTLKMYRSLFHYRNDWKYTSITCDENGAIICDRDDSVL